MLRFRERCSNDVTVNLVDMLAIIRPCRPTCHYTCQSGRRALNDAPCSLTGPPRLLPAFPRQISIGVRRRFRCQATLQITWLAVTVKRPGSQVNLSDASTTIVRVDRLNNSCAHLLSRPLAADRKTHAPRSRRSRLTDAALRLARFVTMTFDHGAVLRPSQLIGALPLHGTP